MNLCSNKVINLRIRFKLDPHPHQQFHNSRHMLHLRRVTPRDQESPASSVETPSSGLGMDTSNQSDSVIAEPSTLSRIHARGRVGSKDHSLPQPVSSYHDEPSQSAPTSWWSDIRIMGLEPSPELLAIALVYFVQGILGLSRLALQFFFKG